MSKIFLGLVWTNHVQVSGKNGKKRIRDEFYKEVVYAEELLSKILGRVRKVYGADNPLIDEVYKQYRKDVKHVVSTGSEVVRTVKHKQRKMFTYAIKPLHLQFEIDGATYKVTEGKGVVHVGGARPWLGDSSKVVLHSGLTDEQAKEQGIIRGNYDPEYLKECIEAKRVAIQAEIDAKAGKGGKQEDDAPPFSVIPDDKPKGKPAKKGKAKRQNSSKSGQSKPQSGKSSGVDVTPPAKTPAKVTPAMQIIQERADKAAAVMAEKVASEVKKVVDQPPKPDTLSGKKFSKRQLNECEKFKIDVNNLPAEKPKGMNNKIWKALIK